MAIPVKSCLLVLLLIYIPLSKSIGQNFTSTPPWTTLGPSVTPSPSPGIPIYDDCVAAQQKTCKDSIDGNYLIKSRTSVGYEDTICRSEHESIPDCTGIGWTYIGSVYGDSSSSETGYDSEHWTAKGDSQTVFESQFWSANVTEVCLSSTGFKIQFPVLAPSLRSLFFENTTLEIPIEHWLNGIKIDVSHLNFTNNCFVSGFNVGDPNSVRVRLGVVSVPDAGQSCSSADMKAIGLGIKVTGKDYGSVHGLWANTQNNIDDVSYQLVNVYVRSRPNTAIPTPFVNPTTETIQSSEPPHTTSTDIPTI